jgi:RNA polymerase sigma factor (sigma-70 family)
MCQVLIMWFSSLRGFTPPYSSDGADRFAPEPPSVLGRMGSGMEVMAAELAHLSDEALVALVARGEEDALAELYDRFGRIAYGLAVRIVRDAALAEDAVQAAFLATWQSASRFMAERASARTWILMLVHRRAVDLVRREDVRRAEALEETERPGGEATEDQVWIRYERDRVREALRALSDQQRELIELAYYGGFTQSELSDRLGLPIGTVKSRMFAGLSRLGELLRDEERDPWSTRTSTS